MIDCHIHAVPPNLPGTGPLAPLLLRPPDEIAGLIIYLCSEEAAFVTVTEVDAPGAAAWFASPAYAAASVCAPTASELTEIVQAPAARVQEPSVLVPSARVTVPVADAGPTETATATVVPTTAGFGAAETVRVVAAFATVSTRADELDAPEQVFFDQNAAAAGHEYYQLGGMEVSPDHRYVALLVDTSGYEEFTLRVLEVATHESRGTALVTRQKRIEKLDVLLVAVLKRNREDAAEKI